MLGINLVYGTGEVHLALHAVADNDHFFQFLGVVFQHDIESRFAVDYDVLWFVTDVTNR